MSKGARSNPPTQPGGDGSWPPLVPGATLAESDTLAAGPPAPPRSIDPDDGLHPIDPGRYQLEGEHARGALGRVLRAHDRRLRRGVAVKQLVDPGGRGDRRFVREALVTARLQHPSIVPVYDAGRWPGGEPFYAMKMVDGRTLEALIGEATTFAARMALVPNVIAIAEAMAYAHGQRIIHRDLKPSNVLVGQFGETVVVDWGLAKDLAAGDEPDEPVDAPAAAEAGLTVAGTVMGTPAYMPPEQAVGRAVDERADVYALGAVLYHVLAGAPPFHGTSARGVLAAVLAGAPPAISARQPGVARDLAAIVDKAMAREPGDRYPSARQLAEDLVRFQTGQLVASHGYTRRELLVRWVRRNRAALVVAATLLLVLAIVGVLSLRNIVRAERAAQDSARHATEQARAATAARQQAVEALAVVQQRERERAAAEARATAARELAEVATHEMTKTKGDLQMSADEFRRALAESRTLQERASAEAARAEAARAEAVAARTQLEELLARERERFKRLQEEKRTLSTELK